MLAPRLAVLEQFALVALSKSSGDPLSPHELTTALLGALTLRIGPDVEAPCLAFALNETALSRVAEAVLPALHAQVEAVGEFTIVDVSPMWEIIFRTSMADCAICAEDVAAAELRHMRMARNPPVAGRWVLDAGVRLMDAPARDWQLPALAAVRVSLGAPPDTAAPRSACIAWLRRAREVAAFDADAPGGIADDPRVAPRPVARRLADALADCASAAALPMGVGDFPSLADALA